MGINNSRATQTQEEIVLRTMRSASPARRGFPRNTGMKAIEFAKTHSCDPDWIAIMGQAEVKLLKPGQTGTYVGLPATVARHYHNGMYEIHVPGGLTCVSGSDFVADQDVPVSAPMSEPDTNEPEADPEPAP